MHLPSIGLILPLLSPRQITPDYESYGPCAQDCAEPIALDSGCSLTPETALYACLCYDASAQTQLAQCVYTNCGAQTLNATAVIHDHNCQINESPSVLSESQIIAAGEGTGSSSSPLASVGLATNSVSSTSAIQMSTSSHVGSILLTSASLASLSTATGVATPTSSPTPTTSPSTSSSGGGSNRLSTASTVCAIIFPALTIIVTIVLASIKLKHSKAGKEKERTGTGVIIQGL